jgi:hypothetical protein
MTYKTHKLPKTLPGNWIASCKQPSSAGCYESFICVRASDAGSYDKYQVHSAYYKDEGEQKGWCYACGDYCKDLPSAMASFVKRAGLNKGD